MDWDVILWMCIGLAVGVAGFLLEWRRGHRQEQQVRALELAHVHHEGKVETAIATLEMKIERLDEKCHDTEDYLPKDQGDAIAKKLDILETFHNGLYARVQKLEEDGE